MWEIFPRPWVVPQKGHAKQKILQHIEIIAEHDFKVFIVLPVKGGQEHEHAAAAVGRLSPRRLEDERIYIPRPGVSRPALGHIFKAERHGGGPAFGAAVYRPDLFLGQPEPQLLGVKGYIPAVQHQIAGAYPAYRAGILKHRTHVSEVLRYQHDM